MDNKIIKQPKIFSIIGIAYLIVFLLIALYFLIVEFTIEGLISMCIICIPGLIFLLFGLLWKIELNEEEFIFTNFIGIKKKYNYGSLKILWNKNGYKVSKNKKIITRVSIYAINFDSLQTKIVEFNKKNKTNNK